MREMDETLVFSESHEHAIEMCVCVCVCVCVYRGQRIRIDFGNYDDTLSLACVPDQLTLLLPLLLPFFCRSLKAASKKFEGFFLAVWFCAKEEVAPRARTQRECAWGIL